MRASFAFDKNTSPVASVRTANVTVYPEAEYMALCQFNSVNWEFDFKHNQAPILVFDGHIERLDTIETKFPHNIDAVYFSEKAGMPPVRFYAQFDEDQLADLAKKGFWSDSGVHLQEVLTNAKFQLEVKAVVEEVTEAYTSQKAPIMNISISNQYENNLVKNQYDLVKFISREQLPEDMAMNKSSKTYETLAEDNIAAEVEAAKADIARVQAEAEAAAFVPPTQAEMDIMHKSESVGLKVDSILEEQRQIREEGNKAAQAERDRIAAEEAARAAKSVAVEKDPNDVDFNDTPISKAAKDTDGLVMQNDDETAHFESNEAIFNGDTQTDEEIPESIAAFMARLGADSENSDTKAEAAEASDKSNKKTSDVSASGSNNSSDSSGSSSSDSSGAASGARGLGVYTFEDQDTAHFAMRADEGKGNEKEDEDEEDNEKDKENDTSSAPEMPDIEHRKVQLTATVSNTDVSVTEDSHDMSK